MFHSSGQYFPVEGTIGAHYTLWGIRRGYIMEGSRGGYIYLNRSPIREPGGWLVDRGL